MKRYTQKEFDALPVVDGHKECPTGDYTQIKNFGERCSFLDHKRLTALVISIFKEPVRRQDAALRDSRRPSTSTNSTGGLPSVRMA